MNDKKQDKVYATSDYSDRTIGMRYIFEKIEENQIRYDKPLIETDRSKYVFYNEPEPDVREKILAANQIYIVDKARFKKLLKIEFLNGSIKQIWVLYQRTKNKYFLYDAICLYRYAEIIPPLEIVSEAYELFSQIAEICINKEEAKEKQEQVLSLLNLKSRGKGNNTEWNQYINALSDMIVFDVVENIRDENPDAQEKFIWIEAVAKLNKTVSRNPQCVTAIVARANNEQDVQRAYKRAKELFA